LLVLVREKATNVRIANDLSKQLRDQREENTLSFATTAFEPRGYGLYLLAWTMQRRNIAFNNKLCSTGLLRIDT
jgi:hypothetical protein